MDLRNGFNFAIVVLAIALGAVVVSPAPAANILFIADIDDDGMGDGNVPDNAASDAAMLAHLQGSHTVTALDDGVVTSADLTGQDLVVISATVFSGQILTSFDDPINPIVGDGALLFESAVPFVNMENGLADNILFNDALLTGLAFQAEFPGQTSIDILPGSGTGKSAGPLTVYGAGADVVVQAHTVQFVAPFPFPEPPSIAPGGVAFATINSPGFPPGTDFAAAFAVPKGGLLGDYATTATSTRVASFVGKNAFDDLTADGLMLFDFLIDFALLNPQYLEGDVTFDGEVDIGDFTLWGDQFGETGGGWASDISGDLFVDIGDFTLWADNFGSTVGAGTAAPAAVPEPASLTLLLCAVAGLLVFSRWGRRKRE